AKTPRPERVMAHARFAVLLMELFSAAHCPATSHHGTFVAPCWMVLSKTTGCDGLETTFTALAAPELSTKLVPLNLMAPPPAMRTAGCVRLPAPRLPPTMLNACTFFTVRSLT